MNEKSDSTRDRIKIAAWEVFVEKGRDGARIQEIADRASANKALIFYYFTSKDDLFDEILRDIFQQVIESAKSVILQSDSEPVDLIRAIVETYLDFLSDHPHLPRVMTREIQSGNPHTQTVLRDLFHQEGLDMPKDFSVMLNYHSQKGNLRQIDPQQTIISFLGLCIFYFIAKPLINFMWDMNEEDEKEFIKQRKEAIIDLILYGLLPR